MRYRFYREHKYISFMLAEFERKLATTDFTDDSQLDDIQQQLVAIELLLKGHAQHENETIHELLREKSSILHQVIENDHERHEQQLQKFKDFLHQIKSKKNTDEKLILGYELYLDYRLFVSDNLRHLHQEETVIMPELQKLYSDKELREIEFNTYDHMTPVQMVHMMQVLFPHMDANDREVFLTDIKDAQPAKFAKAWINITPLLAEKERKSLLQKWSYDKQEVL